MRAIKLGMIILTLLMLSSCTIALDCTTVQDRVRVERPLYDQYGNYVRSDYHWETRSYQVCNGVTARGKITIN